MVITATGSWQTLQQLRLEMRQEFIERNDEIDGVLLCALTRQHGILVGPPGAAKTLMIRALVQAVYGTDDPTLEQRYFETTLSPFSTPDSLFGMLDPKEFEQGRYRFASSGFLQHAEIAYVDEIFNGNPGIMQATQNIINERVFAEGDRRVRCPLQFVLASTNVYPEEGSNLEAFYDRFLLRYHTQYIADGDAFEGFWLGDKEPEIITRFKQGDLDELRGYVSLVSVTPDIAEAVREIRDRVNRILGTPISDRRWRWCKSLIRANAVIDGRDTVNKADLLVLQHALWERHEQKPDVLECIAEIAAPGLVLISRTLAGAIEEFDKVDMPTATNHELYQVLSMLDIAAAEIKQHCSANDALKGNQEVQAAMDKVKAMHSSVARAHARSMARASAHVQGL